MCGTLSPDRAAGPGNPPEEALAKGPLSFGLLALLVARVKKQCEATELWYKSRVNVS